MNFSKIHPIDLNLAMPAASRAIVLTKSIMNDCVVTSINSAFTELTGYESHEVIGRNCRFLQGADSDRQVAADIRRAVSDGLAIHREILNYRKNGEPFWNDVTIDPIRDDMGTLIGFIGMQHDVSAAHLAKEGQVEAELRLENFVRNVPGYVYRCVLKPDGTIELPYLSPSVNGLLGIAEGEAVTGPEFYSRVHPDDYHALELQIRRSASEFSMLHEEFRLVSSNGTVRWFRSDAPPRRIANGDIVWDGLAIEITLEKISEAEAAFLEFQDSLTGLSNRARFKNALINAIESCSPPERVIGLFFVDIDAFQEINNSLGHSAGDDVLRAVGIRLKAIADDAVGTVARLNGDEYALVLPIAPAAGSISSLCAAISQDIGRKMTIADTEIAIQVCVGAALSPIRPRPAYRQLPTPPQS